MKTQIRFRSKKFPPYPGEEEQMNPGIWGKRLAEYLATRLAENGIETGEMNAEDWGWFLPIKTTGPAIALCCGHQDGEDDEFLCFTEPSTPVVRKLFSKVDLTPQLSRVLGAIEQILAADPDVRDVVWEEPG